MKPYRTCTAAALALAIGGLAANAASAKTEIQWWHAMGITISGDLV